MRLHSQIDEFIHSKRKRFATDRVPSHLGRNRKVFLSHAASDVAVIERFLNNESTPCADNSLATRWNSGDNAVLRGGGRGAFVVFAARAPFAVAPRAFFFGGATD